VSLSDLHAFLLSLILAELEEHTRLLALVAGVAPPPPAASRLTPRDVSDRIEDFGSSR